MDALSHRMAIGRFFGKRIRAGTAAFQVGMAGISALPFTVTNGERRPFSGANLFVLLQMMQDQGWTDSRFFTRDQITQAGWAMKTEAKVTSLQFLFSLGQDGLPLATPMSKQFQVVNASEILGVPGIVIEPSASVKNIEEAAIRAGYSVSEDGLNLAIHKWLCDLHGVGIGSGYGSTSEAMLRVLLADSILSVQAGLPHIGGMNMEVSSEWARAIDSDPISFFHAVRDAEKLSGLVMSKVREIKVEHEAELSSTPPLVSIESINADSVGGGNKVRASSRVEGLFLERQAILAVPYAEKARADALGAVFYGPQKIWFVPKGVDLDLFKEWNPRSQSMGAVATRDVLLDSFKEAMNALGVDSSGEILDDGKWHYVPVTTKKSKGNNKSGSYILSLNGARDGGAMGTIINRDSGESFTWRHDGELLTPEQRARLRAESLMREEAAVRETAALQEKAAVHANEIWASCLPADKHGYVIKKGISSVGLKQTSGEVLLHYDEFRSDSGGSIIRAKEKYLIVPMMNSAGEIRAVQAISEDGSVKSFMRGAQKKGTMLVMGANSFDQLIEDGVPAIAFVEGVATGASFREGSGLPVAVCFDAGNLETVVSEMTARLPAETLRVIGADNDQYHVERAVGFLSEKLGLLSFSDKAQSIQVRSGVVSKRSVSLGEVVADGKWHESPKGSYCVTFEHDKYDQAVDSLVVEIVPIGGRKLKSTFENRGIEAGWTALEHIKQKEKDGIATSAVMVTPEFISLSGRPTDWNDLHQREGFDVLRLALSGVAQVDLAGIDKTRSLIQGCVEATREISR